LTRQLKTETARLGETNTYLFGLTNSLPDKHN
jgi:hypothetical protein